MICQHIRGHQDKKGSESTPPLVDKVTGQIEEPLDDEEMGRVKDEPQLSLPAQLNVLCDRLANETAAAVLAEVLHQCFCQY